MLECVKINNKYYLRFNLRAFNKYITILDYYSIMTDKKLVST